MKIKFHTVLWGTEYINTFFNLCMPFNIKEIEGIDVDAEFVFDTVKADAIDIRDRMDGYKVKINVFDDELIKEPQVVLFDKCRAFFEKYSDGKNHLKILGSDVLYYGLGNMINFIKNNKRFRATCVPIGAIRVVREPFADQFIAAGRPHSIEELFFITMQTMHPETWAHFINSSWMHPYPAMILANNVNGIRVNSFIAQPGLLRPRQFNDFLNPEYDLMDNNFDISEVHFAKDMYEAFDVTPTPYYHNWPNKNFTVQDFAAFMHNKRPNKFMLECFKRGFNCAVNHEPMDRIAHAVISTLNVLRDAEDQNDKLEK